VLAVSFVFMPLAGRKVIMAIRKSLSSIRQLVLNPFGKGRTKTYAIEVDADYADALEAAATEICDSWENGDGSVVFVICVQIIERFRDIPALYHNYLHSKIMRASEKKGEPELRRSAYSDRHMRRNRLLGIHLLE
jgi:hypothetical protein